MMNREDYESLVSSSGWGAFKTYLLDNRAKIAEAIVDGNVNDDKLKEAIHRCQDMKDIAEIDWPTIAKFYGITETKEET